MSQPPPKQSNPQGSEASWLLGHAAPGAGLCVSDTMAMLISLALSQYLRPPHCRPAWQVDLGGTNFRVMHVTLSAERSKIVSEISLTERTRADHMCFSSLSTLHQLPQWIGNQFFGQEMCTIAFTAG